MRSLITLIALVVGLAVLVAACGNSPAAAPVKHAALFPAAAPSRSAGQTHSQPAVTASCQEVLDATDYATGVTTTMPDTTVNFDEQSTPTATASNPSPEFSSVITLINNSGMPQYVPPTDVSVVDTYGRYYDLGTTTGGRWVHSDGTVDSEQYNGQSILTPGETISFDVIGTVPTIAQTPNITCQASVPGASGGSN